MQSDPFPASLANFRWHHSIALPDGRVILGDKSLEVMRQQYDMTFGPLDLAGKSVLDIGTWSGAFAIEALRRGAAKVVGLDSPRQSSGRAAFEFVVSSFGAQIDRVELDLDASPLSLSHLGQFDVVLFLGVFYHLVDPIAVLKELYKITRDVLVVETYWAAQLPKHPPAMIFHPGRELANDPNNWWAPNVACVEALLKTLGFVNILVTDGSVANRKVFHASKRPIG